MAKKKAAAKAETTPNTQPPAETTQDAAPDQDQGMDTRPPWFTLLAGEHIGQDGTRYQAGDSVPGYGFDLAKMFGVTKFQPSESGAANVPAPIVATDGPATPQTAPAGPEASKAAPATTPAAPEVTPEASQAPEASKAAPEATKAPDGAVDVTAKYQVAVDSALQVYYREGIGYTIHEMGDAEPVNKDEPLATEPDMVAYLTKYVAQ